VDRVKRSQLGWIEASGLVEKCVVQPDEMNPGQETAGFRQQVRQAGAPYDPDQLDSE
jgi:hypothetical protein